MKAGLNSYKKVFRDIDSKKDIASLYLLKGDEPFIMGELADRIAVSLVKEDLKSFNLVRAYGSEVDLDSFLTVASSYPFLSDRRVLILKELERLRGGWKKLIDYCLHPLPSTVIILMCNTHDEQGRRIRVTKDMRALESAINDTGRIIKFQKLSPGELTHWIRIKAKRMGMDLDEEVAASLASSVGGNLFEIQNELDKMSLLFEGRKLTVDDLASVIGSYRLNAIWDLIGSIRPGNEKFILWTLHRIINTGAERPTVIVYHLIRHFLTLLKIKAGKADVGYGFKRMKEMADRYSKRDILLWLENLRITDLKIKTTTIPEVILLASAILHSLRGVYLEATADIHSAA